MAAPTVQAGYISIATGYNYAQIGSVNYGMRSISMVRGDGENVLIVVRDGTISFTPTNGVDYSSQCEQNFNGYSGHTWPNSDNSFCVFAGNYVSNTPLILYGVPSGFVVKAWEYNGTGSGTEYCFGTRLSNPKSISGISGNYDTTQQVSGLSLSLGSYSSGTYTVHWEAVAGIPWTGIVVVASLSPITYDYLNMLTYPVTYPNVSNNFAYGNNVVAWADAPEIATGVKHIYGATSTFGSITGVPESNTLYVKAFAMHSSQSAYIMPYSGATASITLPGGSTATISHINRIPISGVSHINRIPIGSISKFNRITI